MKYTPSYLFKFKSYWYKDARDLYDHLALGPLGATAKYGPDYQPPSEDCLKVRDALEEAIAKGEGK